MAKLKFTKNVHVDLKRLKVLQDSLDKLYRIKGVVGIFDPLIAKYMYEQHEGTTYSPPGSGRTYDVPPRPFFSIAIRKSKDKVLYALSSRFTSAIFGRGGNQVPTFSVLKKAVEAGTKPLLEALKEVFFSGELQKLSKVTIREKRRKGYPLPATPLYATGEAFKSITVKILGDNNVDIT